RPRRRRRPAPPSGHPPVPAPSPAPRGPAPPLRPPAPAPRPPARAPPRQSGSHWGTDRGTDIPAPLRYGPAPGRPLTALLLPDQQTRDSRHQRVPTPSRREARPATSIIDEPILVVSYTWLSPAHAPART